MKRSSSIPVSYTHLDVYKRQLQLLVRYWKDYKYDILLTNIYAENDSFENTVQIVS